MFFILVFVKVYIYILFFFMKKIPKDPRVLLIKIKRYESLKKIAKSIKLVSFALLNRGKKKLGRRDVSFSFIKMFYNMIDYDSKEWFRDELCIRCTIIIMTSDKSCCGIMNLHILKKSMKFVNDLRSKLVSIITIGSTAWSFLKFKFKYLIKYRVFDLEDESLNLFISYLISLHIFNTKYDRFFFFFCRYINPMTQIVVTHEIFSYQFLWSRLVTLRESNSFFDSIIEDNKSSNLLYDFYSFSVVLLVLNAFQENDISSLAARAKTMDNAVNNVEKLVMSLRLRYNKSRQSMITNEIIEVLNGIL